MVSAKAVCTRILVTGGAGFIGSHVVDALLADKTVERVVAVDAVSDGAPAKASRAA